MSARLQESDLLVERNKRGRATVYSQLEEFTDEEDFNPLNLQRKIQDTRRNERDSLPPSIKQIENFKCRQNKSEAIVSLEQLKAYAIRNAAVPEEDENKTFVCGFASSVISEKIVFCLTWTTVKLRRFQQQSKMIQVDATYKLNWHGFPVLVCGFSVSSQHFCGTFLALSSNENTWCYERFFAAVSSFQEDWSSKLASRALSFS
uniref:MULE transposase domain-containing protein n=1 Tax=Ditylenchus dipsaci TaxID=166011 RepID=A0A915EBK2_9BILA